MSIYSDSFKLLLRLSPNELITYRDWNVFRLYYWQLHPKFWGESLLSIPSILWNVIRAFWVFGLGMASQNI
ncbi:MAG: hypothetical protein V7L29_32265 [Nostoc sp.]|uniref:hypothetical protein n=1 Tax=Nostoc sp. TaxID=1180 RepID=UPI002FFA472E